MSFAEVTAVEQLDSHTYRASFSPAWVIGSVPHGGYVTACFLAAVRKHFDTTLRKQDQPHTIALHLDFLRRTDLGPAIFKIKDVKLGRQASVIHVMLYQNGSEEVVGYVTNSNLKKESGLSFETSWDLHPRPKPVMDFSSLEADVVRPKDFLSCFRGDHSTLTINLRTPTGANAANGPSPTFAKQQRKPAPGSHAKVNTPNPV